MSTDSLDSQYLQTFYNLRVIAVSPSEMATVCRNIVSFQATWSTSLQSKVVVSVQHQQTLDNHYSPHNFQVVREREIFLT